MKSKNKYCPADPPYTKITAQGGVGTAEEHQFLINYYGLDSVGWGSPFLLVPDVVNIDNNTLELLCNAGEEDFYLSNISPLGVPFNSLKGNTKDLEKAELIRQNKPGSKCPKKYVAVNKEFTEKEICTASRMYQKHKIEEFDSKGLNTENYQKEYDQIVDKSCICVGLGTPALLVNDLDTKIEGAGVSVCPGPNLAYFSKRVSLKEMVDHIYGRINIIKTNKRPHMFMKELNMYIDFFRNKVNEIKGTNIEKQIAGLQDFKEKLNTGINYYKALFSDKFKSMKSGIINEFEVFQKELNGIKMPVNISNGV